MRDPGTAHNNKIIRKSTVSPEKYGVMAKRFIPKGTFLGFFKGLYVVAPALLADQPATPIVIDGFYMYRLDEYSYIDGRDFLSCFARYYAWSRVIQEQNVSVHRLTVWNNFNRAVCFMANKDIEKGQELIIPFNQDYVIRKKHKTYGHADCSENDLTAQAKAALFDN